MGLDVLEKKKTHCLLGIRPRYLGHPFRTLGAKSTELSRLMLNNVAVRSNCYTEHCSNDCDQFNVLMQWMAPSNARQTNRITIMKQPVAIVVY